MSPGWALVGLALLAACGTAQETVADPSAAVTSTTVAPSLTIATPTTGARVPVTSSSSTPAGPLPSAAPMPFPVGPEPERTGDPCRDGEQGPTSTEGAIDIGAAQQELEDELVTVQAYGQAHPEVYSGVGYAGGRDAYLIAWFVEPLDVHRVALAGLIGESAPLVVCPAPVSALESERIQVEILALLGGEFIAVGQSYDGRIEVTLPAGAEARADELIARYGDVVAVIVGAFPYPLDGQTWAVCPDPTPPAAVAAGVTLALAPVTASSGAPDDVRTTVTAANAGGTPLEVGDVRLVEVLDDAGTVAVFTGGMTMEYRMNVVEPGASLALDLIVPLASCRPEVGSVLPPGLYTMRAVTLLGTVDAPLTVTS